MSNSIGYSRRDAYVTRFVLSLFLIVFAIMAIVELAVALDLQHTRALAGKAMVLGSMMWIFLALFSWLQWSKKKTSIWLAVPVSIIAEISVLGNYAPRFVGFALIVNAVLSIMFFMAVAWAIPQVWRDCGYVPNES